MDLHKAIENDKLTYTKELIIRRICESCTDDIGAEMRCLRNAQELLNQLALKKSNENYKKEMEKIIIK